MNREKIYEIFRACRLCGVGAGYKMPIIQNIIDIENEEIALRQKIKECVQIEVNLHDPMPPLICELCADKVQDFYEFRRMCHDTNRKTRQRLGLPVQACKDVVSESIVGITEPLNSDSDDGAPLVKQHALKKPMPKSAKVKKDNYNDQQSKLGTYLERSRSSSVEVSERSKGPSKRGTRRSEVEELQELISHATTSTRLRPAPKSINRTLERDTSDCESDTSMSTRSRPAPRSLKRNLDKVVSDTESIDESTLLRPKRTREVPSEPTMAKKSRASMEPSKSERSQKAGPKSSKETPIPTPPPKPGPKSRKLGTSQKIDMSKSKNDIEAKSRRVESLPVTKSKAKAGPKSRMREASPVAPQKTKKVENIVTTASRGKKLQAPLPGPRSKKQRAASPVPDAPALIECNICGAKVKSVHGLGQHCRVHLVTYTPPELACNACEMWFPTSCAVGVHNKLHSNGMPYTCTKCYDDFRTNADYQMHFTRNQCIPNYEVPDVQCDSCWKYFPTYKLLEEHRCAGEAGRPGGKCPSCKRVYTTLKGLRMHEFRCTQKRKVEPRPEPEENLSDAAKGMLPMEVRVVKCDTLLAIADGSCDVAGLSHRFGLDRHSTYPYFYSMGDVKSDPSTSFNHMVAINDDIKQEYLKDDVTGDSFVHWDSDSETDDVPCPKSVRSLSNISLKTLFSPKCLGKVPKTVRKVQPESNCSVLSIDFKRIIDNLGNESNHSGDYDSDSIMDKSAAKNDSLQSESLKENDTQDKTDDGIVETAKHDEEVDRMDDADEKTSNTEEMDDKETLVNENQNDACINTDNCQVINKEVSESSQEDITRTEHLTNSELHHNTNDETEPEKSSEEFAKIAEESLGDSKKSTKNGHLVSNDIVSEEKKLHEENNETGNDIVSEEKNLHEENNETGNDIVSEEKNLHEKNNETFTGLHNTDVEMSDQQDEPISNNANKLEGSDTDSQLSKTNESTDVQNSKQIEDSTNEPHEKIYESHDTTHVSKDKGDEIDGSSTNYTVNDDISMNENVDSSYATDDKVDENDHLDNQDDETHSKDTKNDAENDAASAEMNDSKEDERNNENDTTRNSGDNDTADAEFNNSKDTNQEKTSSRNSGSKNIQSVDKFNINNLDDDEKLLMAEIDAQIGENLPENLNSESESQNDNSDTFGENNVNNENNSEVIGGNSNNIDKNTDIIGDSTNTGELRSDSYTNNDFSITNKGFEEEKAETLDMLLKKDNLNSLDLDSISDEEFDFDI